MIAICGNPPLIERASVIANSTAEGGVAIYTCSSGTVTEGSTSIVCQNDGVWSHTNLYCRRKRLWLPFRNVFLQWNLITLLIPAVYLNLNLKCILIANCGPPPDIPRANVKPGDTVEGSSRFYVCDKSTQTEGITETKCMKNGTWSKIDMYCRRKWSIFHSIVTVETTNNKKARPYNTRHTNVTFLQDKVWK